ncbi:HbrB-like-domain-containing protein [Choanephora cucurbitarum]|nr:HbrB-like-domain-containing protein [Choanephora cucurbitarum]
MSSSTSSSSSISLSTSLENGTSHIGPTRSLSATTLAIRSPPNRRQGERSNSLSQPPRTAERPLPPLPRPSSPHMPSSVHKSINLLDAKSIARDINSFREDVTMPLSPPSPVQPLLHPSSSSTMSVHVPHYVVSNKTDAWQTLCVRVLPLFNGEGVQGAIEELNELLRRCITTSSTLDPQLYHDMESLLRDGMFTLNAKMFGVTDEKLLDRLVEQWSFFFTYALPYFEAVFLPLRTDVRYRSQEEAEMWNVRTMALQSFRDNVILLQTKRLEDVFNKLFTDFGSSQNPAATAAKMLQMTSLLASSPDHNEDIERVLSSLKANWKIMMTKGDRRGFAGVKKNHLP